MSGALRCVWAAAAAVLVLITAAAPALAQQVSAGLFSSGSGAAQSATFRLRSHAIGQAIGGSPTASASYGLKSGAQIADAAGLDSDGDGLSDAAESTLGTQVLASDSDSDGLTDFEEVNRDGNPSSYQPGADTNPLDPDTDDDGLLDGRDPTPLGGVPIPALPSAVGVTLAALLVGASLSRLSRL